jgi:transposase
MPRFKPHSYDQLKMIPIDFTRQLQPGTFEFALNQIVDEMDLSVFDHWFHNDDTGAPAYDPAILLKIVLFAYSRGITSSREIAAACRENVLFIALSADSRPHFTTIAHFVSSMAAEITPLFRNVLVLCAEEGLIGKRMFAIDGCKISSNCSKEWSGTRADFERRSAKIDRSIKLILRKHRQLDAREDRGEQGPRDDHPRGGMRQKERQAIERLRARKKKLERWLAENEDKRGRSGSIKQSNITDNESAKMPGSHGVIQGYNGVAAVDSKHQVIVHAEAFGEGHEGALLEPMLDAMRDHLKALGEPGDPLEGKTLVADSGYHSEANARMVLEQGIDAYLPDKNFRKRDPAFADAGHHKRSIDRKHTVKAKKYFTSDDFMLDPVREKLICPAGKELFVKNRNFRTHEGYHGTVYMSKKTDCRACALRKKCLRNAGSPVRQVAKFVGRGDTKTATQEMIERFDTAEGRFLYSRRMGIVEPVFANVCYALGLDWFSLRGKVKVDIQWKLFSIVHNLKKLVRYGPRFAAAG